MRIDLSSPGANPTLQGHTLILNLRELPEGYLDDINRRFPHLKVIHKKSSLFYGDYEPITTIPDEVLKDVTVIFSWGAFPTPDKLPRLQYVQLPSAGAELVVGQPLFQEKRIAFCTANGVNSGSVADWVIGTFLAAQNLIPYCLEQQKQEKWHRTTELRIAPASAGQRVGILGYGSIGRQVARISKALGMDIYAHTRSPRPTPESKKDRSYILPGLGDPDGVYPSKWFSGHRKEDLHAFLSSGLDFLVITVPLTDETNNLIGKEEFEILKERHTFVSNPSRGKIVNTEELIEALESGAIRGAALDVTDPEPLPEGHPLWKAKNVIITPHTGGFSGGLGDTLMDLLMKNLERLSEGKPLINVIDRERGY